MPTCCGELALRVLIGVGLTLAVFYRTGYRGLGAEAGWGQGLKPEEGGQREV